MMTHSEAVDAAIRAASGLTAADQPLLALVRTLAAQMDSAGVEGPGTRLAGTYLTALRTLLARLGPSSDEDTNLLVQLRRERLRGAPSKKRATTVRTLNEPKGI